MFRKHVRRLGAAASLIGTLLLVSAAVSPASQAANDPPGNNGTVKVEGRDIDSRPDNDPHPGCTFLLEFYNYDQGDLEADVTFELQPPTTRSGDDQTILTDTVPIGEDPAGGGGDLDARESYRLDIEGATPQPNQGYHVKLTVNAEGSQGADVKHKTFWVECETPTTTTTQPEGTTTTTTEPSGPTTTTTVAPTTTTTPTTATPTTATPTTGTPPATVQVGGVVETTTTTRPAPAVLGETETRGGELPRTGVDPTLLWSGVATLSSGLAMLAGTRRKPGR